MDNKARALARMQDIERLHEGFPFGSDLSQRVLKRLRLMVALVTDSSEQSFSGRPSDEHIYSVLKDAADAYKELGRMSHIQWIEHHELVLKRFCALLSRSRRKKYFLPASDLTAWRYGVVLFAKSFSKKLRAKQMPQEEFEGKAQICIDVIHDLLTILRDNTEQGLFHDDSVFLVNLCQRAMLLPKSFVSSATLLIENDAPIDTGASSEVYRGTLGDTQVAVKSFRLYFRTGYLVRKRFIKEALILQMAQHPNVLRFMSIVHEKSNICIITPWHAHGHIMKYIAAVPGVPRKELLEQVADGLHFLSEYNIVHGDLKGGNILIDDDGRALIADLGLSFIQQEQEVPQPSHTVQDPMAYAILRKRCTTALRSGKLALSPTSISSLAASIMSVTAKSSTGGGTFRWMAPERLVPSAFDRPSAKATASSDVYSFGMLMLEVYTGAPPWASQRAEGTVLLSVVSNIRPPRPTDGSIGDDVWSIVEQCWAHLPQGRPTISQVYNRLACIP